MDRMICWRAVKLCAASAVVGLRALWPDPGLVRAVGKVLMGNESHLRDSMIPEKI